MMLFKWIYYPVVKAGLGIHYVTKDGLEFVFQHLMFWDYTQESLFQTEAWFKYFDYTIMSFTFFFVPFCSFLSYTGNDIITIERTYGMPTAYTCQLSYKTKVNDLLKKITLILSWVHWFKYCSYREATIQIHLVITFILGTCVLLKFI